MVDTQVIICGNKLIKLAFSFLLVFHFLTLGAHENSEKSRFDLLSVKAEQSIRIPGNKINQEDNILISQPVITEDPYIKFDCLTKKNGLRDCLKIKDKINR